MVAESVYDSGKNWPVSKVADDLALPLGDGCNDPDYMELGRNAFRTETHRLIPH
jgi:hypothetical protein